MTLSPSPAEHQKLYGLDHLRAMAITFVFLFHYFILSGGKPTWLPDVAEFGWTGVDLFFVLSGFLISSQLFAEIKRGERISIKTFFLKRFFRIIPAFWVVITIYFCIPFFREKEALAPLWKYLTFTHNLGLNLHGFGTFSHAWSLCVEEHFYLFLPLILLLLQRIKGIKRSFLLLIFLCIAGFVTRIYSFNNFYLPYIEEGDAWVHWYRYIYYPTYNRLDGLLAGVTIAGVYVFYPITWTKISRYGNWIMLLGLGVLTGAYFLCETPRSYAASVVGFPLIALGYGCLLTGAVSPGSILYRWRSKVTTFIATLSYAIYLTHKGVIHMTHQLLADMNLDANLLLLISVITCIMGALLLHWLVEKPFMKLRSRLVKKDDGQRTKNIPIHRDIGMVSRCTKPEPIF